METNLQHENTELKARLRAFAAIMRLGKDAAEQTDLTSVGIHIVNNSRTLLAYERSSLLDLRGRMRMLAEYSQVEVKENTEYADALKTLCAKLDLSGGMVEISENSEIGKTLSGKALDAFESLTDEGMVLLFVPLRSARHRISAKEPFVWVLEYRGSVPPHVAPTLPLLSPDYGNALWNHVPTGGAGVFLRWLRKITLIV